MKNVTSAKVRGIVGLSRLGLGLLLFCLPALAQLNLGRISGALTDQSGGVIVGATVTVIDVQRGISRPLTTDAAGEYVAPSLTPGTYTVRAEAVGFKVLERTEVAVGVGQDIRIDLVLQPGAQTQTVTVTEEAPLVNTTNATLGGTLENQTLSELPLNGGDYLTLLTLRPGVLQKPTGTTVNTLSSYGGRPEEAVFLFDGVWDNNIFAGGKPIISGGSVGGADQQSILPIDAIQEVNVMENANAEFGWNPGAQVNVGLKSGTNDIHGTAYAFGRDAALNAKNAFLTAAQPKGDLQLKEYGASIGGPIKKDKLFYFGSYEGEGYLAGVPKLIQEPTTDPGAGVSNSFPDAIAAMNAAHIPISQLSLNLAGCTAAGSCNAANGLFGNSNSSQTFPISLNTYGGSNNAIVKVDYHLNDHNSINGDFYFSKGAINGASSTSPPVQQYWDTDITQNAEVARAVWIWTPNSSWVNEARFGFDRSEVNFLIYECEQPVGPKYSSLGFVSGAVNTYITTPNCGFPSLTVTGFNAIGNGSPQLQPQNSFTGLDTVSYTRGKHVIKFGGEIRETYYPGAPANNALGTLAFGAVSAFTGATPLEDFLAGVPASGTLAIGNANRAIHVRSFAAFVEDAWRVSSRLTVNAGLRWEYEGPVTDSNNLLGNFDPNTATGLIQEANGNSLYNAQSHNFAPRLGLAWDVTGKGTTVVHAGGSMAYVNPPLQDFIGVQGAQLNLMPTGFQLYSANGTAVQGPGNIETGTVTLTTTNIPWAVNTPVFNGTASGLACGNGVTPNPAPCSLNAINPNLRSGYVTTWTLGVQHALTRNLSLDVSYVGNHGTDLVGDPNINSPTPGAKNASGKSSVGPPATGGYIEQSRRPFNAQFPYFSIINYFTNLEESNYAGLQLNLTQRVSHGLSFNFGYTFAHALDENSDETTDTIMNQSDPRADYGNSLNDARHRVTLTMTYQIPGRNAPAQLLRGWEFNSAVTFISALPYNAVDTTSDISGTGRLLDRWTMVGSAAPFNAYGGAAPIPCYGSASTTVFTAKNGCTIGLPAACTTAAAAEPGGPGGTTGTASLNTLGCYMAGNSVIVPPAQGTFGSMPRDGLRGQPLSEWDASLSKSIKFNERISAQFRAEFFNLLNHVSYAAPNANPDAPVSFGQSQSTPNLSNPIIGNFSPREIQFGLKLLF